MWMKPTTSSSEVPWRTGYRECSSSETSFWASSIAVSAEKNSTSVRGVMICSTVLSPTESMSTTISRSSSPIVSWLATKARSSATPIVSFCSRGLRPRSLSTTSVDRPRNQITGRSKNVMTESGRATTRAIVSADWSAMRLGTSSPQTTDR